MMTVYSLLQPLYTFWQLIASETITDSDGNAQSGKEYPVIQVSNIRPGLDTLIKTCDIYNHINRYYNSRPKVISYVDMNQNFQIINVA